MTVVDTTRAFINILNNNHSKCKHYNKKKDKLINPVDF